jgi:ribonuclease BN (tRNA processing enzyme)
MLEVQFIGTGDAFCSGGRRNSAILLREKGRTLLLDCGPTTLIGLKALGIDPREIDAIAISHFHGDHAAGAPFLMLDYIFENKRTSPLEIIGPPGIEELTQRGCAQFHFDTEIKRTYELTYREYDCGTKLETCGFSILPLPATHHPETRPHMLRVATESRAVFFSGDTGWHDALPSQVGDVNLFICECTLLEEGFEYHISHERMLRERNRFASDQILLTHMGSRVLANLDRVQFDTATDGLRVAL